MRAFKAAALLLCILGCTKAVEPPKKQTDYAMYMTSYPFGGHRVDWWETRLTELAPGGAAANPDLYALTKERAEKNGLVVEVQGERHIVKPGPELSKRLMERLGVQ
jgi:hypothetical protein